MSQLQRGLFEASVCNCACVFLMNAETGQYICKQIIGLIANQPIITVYAK